MTPEVGSVENGRQVECPLWPRLVLHWSLQDKGALRVPGLQERRRKPRSQLPQNAPVIPQTTELYFSTNTLCTGPSDSRKQPWGGLAVI